jgi:DNA mismatch repair protein MutS
LGNDNLFKSLSTFAVEMCELRTILKNSNANSLILGDELCSGTESSSALSIFTAGLQNLHKKNSTFLFATHFHEIINYEEIIALTRIRMMHMEVIYDEANDCLVYNRKLKKGPGNSMYGLEVCKSLGLPDDFLKEAMDIRIKYNEENSGILSHKQSHYNAKKIKGMCELCNKKIGEDIHHLQYQNRANDTNDYIDDFHKNHKANLVNICKQCHDNIHHNDTQLKKAKTTKGYKLQKI